MALQSHFEGFSAGFKCSNVEKKSGGKKKKSDALPPPLIICGAGVARAAATGAYKDLCARKGVRLQPRNEWGRSALGAGRPDPRFGNLQLPLGRVLRRPPGPRMAVLEGR